MAIKLDLIGTNLNIVFGSSRYTRNLILDNDNHLLQSRDYFSGTMVDLFYSTNRVKFKDNPIFLSASLSMPLKGINIENDSFQSKKKVHNLIDNFSLWNLNIYLRFRPNRIGG